MLCTNCNEQRERGEEERAMFGVMKITRERGELGAKAEFL